MSSLREKIRVFLCFFFTSSSSRRWINGLSNDNSGWGFMLLLPWLLVATIIATCQRIYNNWQFFWFSVDDFLVNTVADFYFNQFWARKKKEYLLLWENMMVPALYSYVEAFMYYDHLFFGDFKSSKSFPRYNCLFTCRRRRRLISPLARCSKSDIKILEVTGFVHLITFYTFIKNILLPLIVSLLLVFILISYFTIDTLTHEGVWIVVGFLFFWLMSGFNFFLKRYRFGKFTSAIQRFWKRTNSYFWLIEGFLFGLFFYYYLNSSQEPLYMYDESNLNQNHLSSLPVTYSSFILLIFMIFYSYYILINLNSFTFKQKLTHLTIVTFGLLFIFLMESYQFYYIITLFYENIWFFDAENAVWDLTFENPRIRVKQQYLILALIAKYWHFLFIFFSWLFLILKVYEQKKIYYPLFGLNLQNFIILFCLNILFSLNWLKWIIRRYYDVTYYWFFIDVNNHFLNTFNSELYFFFF